MNNAEREFSIEVINTLRDAGFEAMWAGGCVRDLLLGTEPGDFDVATSATPDEVKQLFRRTLNVGAAVGVMIVVGKKQQGQIEVATFRADGEYLDGRRPEDVTFCSAEQDALRRDFTINGMFYDPVAEEVIDYVGGRKDLDARVIRAIGNARDRFEEDKLRLLRAVRFAARLGFGIEEETLVAIAEMAPQINVVSAERIAQELHKMLLHPNRMAAVELSHECGLLAHFLSELDFADEAVRSQALATTSRLDAIVPFERSLAALLLSLTGKQAAKVCRRLRMANKETDAVNWLVENQDALHGASEFSLARLKRLLAHPLSHDLTALVRARDEGTDAVDSQFCDEYVKVTPRDVIDPPPVLTGDDLVAAGCKPGPQFKSILDTVRDAQLNNEVSSLEEAMKLDVVQSVLEA